MVVGRSFAQHHRAHVSSSLSDGRRGEDRPHALDSNVVQRGETVHSPPIEAARPRCRPGQEELERPLFNFVSRPIAAAPLKWDGKAIREELFSVERLEGHARSLAAEESTLAKRANGRSLDARLTENGAALQVGYKAICEAMDAGQAITPAAEWLVDSYHLVEKQFREVRLDLPPGYYRQLPKLGSGPFAGYPRVFGIAWAFVAHTDSRFDVEMFRRFVLAYQEIRALSIGELWALSITSRIVLIENLRRLADLIVRSRDGRKAANDLANRLLGSQEQAAEPVDKALASWDGNEISDSFAVQFVQRLRDQDARVLPALTWLETRLAETGRTPDQVVNDEHMRQGAATVTVSNIITSLRTITSIDWTEVFESISAVDVELRADPIFPKMDFASRNLYRRAIEELSHGSQLTEIAIARRALETRHGVESEASGAGHWLIGPGRGAFEKAIGFRPGIGSAARRLCLRAGVPGYAAAVAFATFASLWLASRALGGDEGALRNTLLLALAALPASDVAVALVNRFAVTMVPPSILPTLELKTGIPEEFRTLIVVPTLLTSAEDVRADIDALEVHHLASPDGEIYFALLTDWVDADAPHAPGDVERLEAARSGIARLNSLYPAGPAGERFTLLHRARTFNEGEGKWIGWERKRGKLHQLNRFLRGALDSGFLALEGLPTLPPRDARFVITLDADTRLPLDSVRKLVGKMAHPLNRPRFDAILGRIVEGRGVIQPRVTPVLPTSGSGSLFQRVFSTPGGIDPYASAVSEVYQDLFGEGSYAGKGIYDIDAFEAALAGTVPESTLLSHDLFEGVFARAGYASDVEVMEAFPDQYCVAAVRTHRWTRGDWQLAPWIFGFSPDRASKQRERRRIPFSGRWKMLDNLRRSLSAPAAVAALLAGWAFLESATSQWTMTLVAFVVAPMLIPPLCSIGLGASNAAFVNRLTLFADEMGGAALKGALVLVLLADQALLMLDAILRSAHRVLVSRKHLLEWVSHAQASAGSRVDLRAHVRRMRGAVALGAVGLATIALRGAPAGWVDAPLAFAWMISPLVATGASLPITDLWRPLIALRKSSPALSRWLPSPRSFTQPSVLEASDFAELRVCARRTWRYFESFVTAADNMLPPDNFQQTPFPVVAHRTSPTNIGLYLLSVASACDFGWIGRLEAAERIEATLATMRKLERVRGHFYNWYDTQTLDPLEPKYVSSVDSGNLCGHLIALSRTCAEWRADKAPKSLAAGVADALEIARACLPSHADAKDAEVGAIDAALADLVTQARSGHLEPAAVERLMARVAANGGAPPSTHAFWADVAYWLGSASRTLASGDRDEGGEADLEVRLQAIERQARDIALAAEFGFLLDPKRKLLSIGYVVHEDRLDPSCYDLLASEARLASFFAIAKGDLPPTHWFRLGRAVVKVEGGVALLSWSGSMFEYLMPSLVMRAPTGSLIEQSNRLIVRRQISYGAERGVPWGISESAYNVRDLDFTYQYSNFGVPGLGLKRGLDANVVVAPYATALAAMVDPQAAVENLRRLTRSGALGQYGFFEALDYTPVRLPSRETVAIVRAHMAHHQGMTIVAIAIAVLDAAMRNRFHAEPLIQASELLLQERPPRDASSDRVDTGATSAARVQTFELPTGRRFVHANEPTPATHLLSNGRYTTMITSAGSGYSQWGNIALTRWREDPTRDDCGAYIYLRDRQRGAIWSAGYQPCAVAPDEFEAVFNEDRATFTRRDGALTTTMEVVVSGEDDAEVRRISIANSGPEDREIEVTSYMELALAPQAAHRAHPAFSKMFVQTESVADAIIATRRRREQTEPEIWAAHLAVIDDETATETQFETDRAIFLGRKRSVRAPAALVERRLSNSLGTVLDPVFAIRRTLRVGPGAVARIAFWTMVASSRQDLLDCVDKHRDSAAFARAATMAWSQAQVKLHHLGIDATVAAAMQRLCGHLIFASPAMRSSSDAIRAGAAGQPELWSLGISGDLPILAIRVSANEHLGLVRQLLAAHEYFRMKHFAFDLAILNERTASYIQDLQGEIESVVRISQSRRTVNETASSGRIFVLRADLLAAKTRALVLSIARVVLVGQRGDLSDQLDNATRPVAKITELASRAVRRAPDQAPPEPALEFFNGHGGFAEQGREYLVSLRKGRPTPAPWINVVANPNFGFQVSADGAGFTWCVNSRENQLTPWSNDPVADPSGEALYLRDEETGEFWSATADPIQDPDITYVARHGRGYTKFEHNAHGIGVELIQFVPVDDPVKISRLRLRNLTDRRRKLSVTAYVEWALGPSGGPSAPFVCTARDPATGAIFAQNFWAPAFAERVAFLDLRNEQSEWTGDRREFIGRNGDLDDPAAMRAATLGSVGGAGLDPCGALRAYITIPAGGVVERTCLFGQGANAGDARAIISRYRSADLDSVLGAVATQWEELLDKVQVKTPDRALDIMLNGWLLYQTLACRFWARSAFYQASGAYGFRDQLQDGMALAAIAPGLARAHIVRASGRQFLEGDVQHWWLPETGKGVRTRISDDRAWLAYATAHYVESTGDASILDESVRFLEGHVLGDDELERFFDPVASERAASVFEHCALALDQSMALGAHGLPLMGSGDWNDGMNRVGEKGRGESVWLAWFHCSTFLAFAHIAQRRGQGERARRWQSHVDSLKVAIEDQAWDGQWYRRAFYDDGAPLGSAQELECRIDSIAQSWAVISGGAAPARAKQSMASLERELISRERRMALLFTPPFDKSAHDPGYIKGYPPGLRENGGQYTHAALWSVIALTKLGEGAKAAELFAMLNPITHSNSSDSAERYKVEPYVVAADVYAAAGHLGRGGWTWYTGSAGWMQRAGLEHLLGIAIRADVICIQPCIPARWDGFEAVVRHGRARYVISVSNPGHVESGVAHTRLDGQLVGAVPARIALVDDGAEHRIEVVLGGQ